MKRIAAILLLLSSCSLPPTIYEDGSWQQYVFTSNGWIRTSGCLDHDSAICSGPTDTPDSVKVYVSGTWVHTSHKGMETWGCVPAFPCD